jgi:hypothetical protein
MTVRTEILACFAGRGDERPFYLPDLTLWYDWHRTRDSFPERWQGDSLAAVSRAMGLPIWRPVRPWRVEHPGLTITRTEENNERVIKTETAKGTLTARWIVGPDGDWWQSEYPVKAEEDLAAVLEVAEARTYHLDPSELARLDEAIGEDGVLVLELPRRPYSDILHEFLGWSEGLMFLGEPAIPEINALLETKLQKLVEEIAGLPGQLVLSPDNLDGQFVTPPAFSQFLSGSYGRTTEVLHQSGQQLVVHIGGPIRHILASLAEAGVDAIEGLAGPPQSDLTLTEARDLVGPDLILWGGISQDYLLDMHEQPAFEQAIRQAVQEVGGDNRMILGVADRVPVEADINRLEAIPDLIAQAGRA